MSNLQDLGRWPDFLGIGAIKSGTTWLHACLAEHPDIYTTQTKEIEFFNNRYDLGSGWYKSLFPVSEKIVCGESTPGYMHDDHCARRIYDANRSMKLLVCLRNPVDRAFSHYMMSQRISSLSIEAKIVAFDKVARQTDCKFVRFGLYANQLDPFAHLFDKNQLHISLFDEIADDPIQMIQSVYRHIGVADDFLPNSLNTVVNRSALYRNEALFGALRKTVQATERSFLAPFILKLKMNGVRDKVLNWWRVSDTRTEMLAETRLFLQEYYAESNMRLIKDFGLDVSIWD